MDERDLDVWWSKLPLKRKRQLWRWLAKDDGEHRVLPNQIALIEMKGETQ